jgi:hypothetical protein
MNLRLVSGSTVVVLSDASTVVTNYVPVISEEQTVVESFGVFVSRSSVAQVRDFLHEIERMFWKAGENQNRLTDERVYIEINFENAADWWRSEVLSGRVNIPSVELWPQGRQQIDIIVERRNYWEGAEVELPLRRVGDGSAVTGGRNWTGFNEGNALQIPASAVTGSMPAPFRLTLQNNNGTNISTRQFFLSHNVFVAPTSTLAAGSANPLVLEGETALSGGTNFNSSGMRGGQYRSVSFTGSSYTVFWSVPASTLALTRGRWLYGVLRGGFPGVRPALARLRVGFPNTMVLTTLYAGSWHRIGGTNMNAVGAVPLPPGSETGNHTAVSLAVDFLYSTSGNYIIEVDALYLLPMDGFLDFEQLGYQLETNEEIVINGLDKRIYAQSTAGTISVFAQRSDFPQLVPNRTQNLVLLMAEANLMTLSRTFFAKAYYRPRRRSF